MTKEQYLKQVSFAFDIYKGLESWTLEERTEILGLVQKIHGDAWNTEYRKETVGASVPGYNNQLTPDSYARN